MAETSDRWCMARLPDPFQAQVSLAGFVRGRGGLFVRTQGVDIEQVLEFDRVSSSGNAAIKVTAAVRHAGVEELLWALFQRFGLAAEVQTLRRNGPGYIFGSELGLVPAAQLSWQLPMSGVRGHRLSLADATATLGRLRHDHDLRAFLGQHSGEMWSIPAFENVLRRILLVELTKLSGGAHASEVEQAELRSDWHRYHGVRSYDIMTAHGSLDQIWSEAVALVQTNS